MLVHGKVGSLYFSSKFKVIGVGVCFCALKSSKKIIFISLMVSEIFPTSPTYFQIQLQNDSFNSYVAGQTIIGRVVVELKDKLKVTGKL